MKTCSICGETKPLSDYYRAAGMRDGHRKECKACNLAIKRARYEADPQLAIDRVREWQQANPERLREYRKRRNARPEVKRQQRDGYYRRTYGISADEFDRLFAEQGGRCAICGSTPEREASMHIDHDHATGAIRGLLCVTCNQGLGLFQEDPSRVLRAAVYLRNGGVVDLVDGVAG